MIYSNNKKLLNVEDLQTQFFTRAGIVRAVDHVSFCVNEGEAVGIVGESGCGKTITARSIMRLVPEPGKFVGGKVIFKGQNLLDLSEDEMRSIRGERISMVFQDPMTFLNPIMSVGDQIGESIQVHKRLGGKEIEKSVIESLKRVRIPSPEEVINYYPHQLSGGMRQRVLIAMGISCSPNLLIADEPTSALDVTIQAQILHLLKTVIAEMNMALILITHDLSIVADLCDRVYVMYTGQIVEGASVLELFENARHPYTQGLLQSVLSIAEKVNEFKTIPGNVPNLLDLPSGCRFQTRCPHVMPICIERDPVDSIDHDSKRFASCWLTLEEKK